MGVAVELRSQPISEEEYFARPYTGQREELIDGALLVSPAPGVPHQRLSSRLWNFLDQRVPEDLEVQKAINVRLASGRVIIPDVVVHSSVGTEGVFVPAEEVVMIVEIVSPSTKQVDRLLKPGLAAQAGIQFYVLVEPDGPTVTVHELDNGSYRQVVTASGEKTLTVTEPFPVEFRPAELLAARRS
ncbi:Uma2 family endonuclease [Cryptosporangium sp. NPDC048952]|uniref:Uma2 family endonuclease n=1 Tax=Cryptosporangium sp. NPDC048952 TaxID=3363961 RepID=UPI003715C1AE